MHPDQTCKLTSLYALHAVETGAVHTGPHWGHITMCYAALELPKLLFMSDATATALGQVKPRLFKRLWFASYYACDKQASH